MVLDEEPRVLKVQKSDLYLKGELLYKSSCSSCHLPAQNMTGPMLKGAAERWDNDLNEMALFCVNPVAYNGKKKDYVKKLLLEYQTWMSAQNVNAKDLKAILYYCEHKR